MQKINAVNITKKYGDLTVLNKFNCEISPNQTTVIMGASGCGKTTLLNLLMGLEKPTSGEIKGIKNAKIAAVFQENRLCEHLDAVQNIRLVTGKMYTQSEILQALSQMLLTGDACQKPVSQLSGGMKRRVSILRAIMAKSDIVIMDEPFKGLDEETKDIVINLVKNNIKNKTAIIVTHSQNEAEILADKIIGL